MAEKASAINTVRTVNNWIDGKAVPASSNNLGAIYNSATGERCASVVMSTEADVSEAVASAAAAFERN
jgi:malonate-semialdehyde dehydrogenase (acetylating)/methylmalonate-semialdehyde dehydrogenase